MASNKSEYKGNPMMALFDGEEEPEYPFRFGLKKAKLVLDNIDAIREFVEENETDSKTE